MLKFARLDDTFIEVFYPVEGQSLQQKKLKKRRKKEGGKKIPKIEKPKDFLRMPESQCGKT